MFRWYIHDLHGDLRSDQTGMLITFSEEQMLPSELCKMISDGHRGCCQAMNQKSRNAVLIGLYNLGASTDRRGTSSMRRCYYIHDLAADPSARSHAAPKLITQDLLNLHEYHATRAHPEPPAWPEPKVQILAIDHCCRCFFSFQIEKITASGP